MTKAAIALDAINQFLHIGAEVAHFTGSDIKLGVISHIRTVGNANGQSVLKTWKEVQLEGSKRWVKVSRVVRTNRFTNDPVTDW
jgi:hypothetical protein